MISTKDKRQARLKRKKRIRKKILGTGEKPRLSVFRSARHIYVQAIDDVRGHTIVSASSLEPIEGDITKDGGKIAIANAIGKKVAARLIDKGIKEVVFDRNGFLYHGRVKAVSDGAREVGLDF